MEAVNCPFILRSVCRCHCGCHFILFFFPLTICSPVLFVPFLPHFLLLFKLPLSCLLLLPQLRLSLPVLLPLLFICFFPFG